MTLRVSETSEFGVVKMASQDQLRWLLLCAAKPAALAQGLWQIPQRNSQGAASSGFLRLSLASLTLLALSFSNLSTPSLVLLLRSSRRLANCSQPSTGIPAKLMSFFTRSLYRSFGLPLPLLPSSSSSYNYICFGILLSSILATWSTWYEKVLSGG